MAESIANDLTGESQRPKHAGVWVRVAANLLDVVIMGVPVLLLVTLILQAGQDTQSDTVSLNDFYNIETLANAVLLGVVTVLLWVNWDGRTPGKKPRGWLLDDPAALEDALTVQQAVDTRHADH